MISNFKNGAAASGKVERKRSPRKSLKPLVYTIKFVAAQSLHLIQAETPRIRQAFIIRQTSPSVAFIPHPKYIGSLPNLLYIP